MKCDEMRFVFAFLFCFTLSNELVFTDIPPNQSQTEILCQNIFSNDLSNVLSSLHFKSSLIRYLSSLNVSFAELLDMSYNELIFMAFLTVNDVWRIAKCAIIAAQSEEMVSFDSEKWNCSIPSDSEHMKDVPLKSLLFQCSGNEVDSFRHFKI